MISDITRQEAETSTGPAAPSREPKTSFVLMHNEPAYNLERHKYPSSQCTGNVWEEPTSWQRGEHDPSVDIPTNGQTLHFAAKSRTNWHSHAHGEVLRVVSGRGWVIYKEEGAKLGYTGHMVKMGELMWCPPGVVHWYGGDSNAALIVTSIGMGEVEWCEPVSEDDYKEVLRWREGYEVAPLVHLKRT